MNFNNNGNLPNPGPEPDPDPIPDDHTPLNNSQVSDNLSFSVQNVRSLNISTKNDITLQKVIAICNLKTDFIFLSDVRLNSSKQISAVHDLEKHFFFNGYKMYHNSNLPSRGVGILINKKFCNSNFSVIRKVASVDCNLLGLHVSINRREYFLVSLYGPNHDNEIVFYDLLSNHLRDFNCPIIIGGDWNATLDTSEVAHNIDTVNMRNIPSRIRSECINDIAIQFSLVDPFRSANPETKEYTFIPSSLNENNRSRLDFFLISHFLCNPSTICTIPHSLTSTYFDHKPVLLSIKGKKRGTRSVIKDTVIKSEDVTFYVKKSIFECYLQHWVPGNNLDGTVTRAEEIQEKLLIIGRISVLLEEIKNAESRNVLEGPNNFVELTIAGKRAEILLLFEDLPELEFFENLSCSHTPKVFFETLVCCIKNSVLMHQCNIFRLKNLKRTELTKRIRGLKKSFAENTAEILRFERTLSLLEESILKDELLHYKKFENLNNEKITPYFMSLVKSKNSADSLDNLKRDDGSAFNTTDELKGHVHDYYSKIYKQANNLSKNATYQNIIDFLGEVNNNPIVENAKLTENEKLDLESSLTVEELTKSINGANMASAPGADGVSNRFIQHFWAFFKTPLLRLCNQSFDEGELPLFLRTANIKLIPKKGDTTKIKNWRPISLLNCFYKIISRAITSRLRKYMDKMTPICQKGYSGTRYCQEVLITVIESIEKCQKKQKKAALLSLDIKKAFDSLSHSYMQGVYKFFNFGPRLIKWLTIMCTNRKACVIIDEAVNTEFFDLERGNAQGDTISPFLFNLGYQILLFKLDLSLQIEGILSEFAERATNHLQEQNQGQGQGRAAQVNNHDPRAFALADDCSLLVKLTAGNLRNIIEILGVFEGISGLECNVEKTALMAIGPQSPLDQEILDLGFELKDEITLLGAKIKNTGTCYEGNIGTIIDKVRKQANFWKRFNLSLPGRICVAKTFLYSQINYLGCFLPLTVEEINTLSKIIEEFVGGNLRIAKNRYYLKRTEGGLEMLNLHDYIGAQCCSWLKRSVHMDELWKRELFLFSNYSVFNIRQSSYNRNLNPILYYVAGYAEKFIFNFTSVNENFLSSPIFENPCLSFENNRPHFLKKSFFSE